MLLRRNVGLGVRLGIVIPIRGVQRRSTIDRSARRLQVANKGSHWRIDAAGVAYYRSPPTRHRKTHEEALSSDGSLGGATVRAGNRDPSTTSLWTQGQTRENDDWTLPPDSSVYVRNYGQWKKWIPGRVKSATGARMVTVETPGAIVRRHVDQVRRRPDSPPMFPVADTTARGPGATQTPGPSTAIDETLAFGNGHSREPSVYGSSCGRQHSTTPLSSPTYLESGRSPAASSASVDKAAQASAAYVGFYEPSHPLCTLENRPRPVECPMPEVTAANETVSLLPMAERL
ncbi:hypothetical protein MTO96_002904 [Rhipicephalus appendiculatus]